jgi:ABC-type uncharacterized transport system substrate-binding protein
MDGRANLRIDVRWAEGKADRISAYAAELIGIAPDVIFASGPAVVSELRKRTRTIPIVFVQVPDPVELGLVVSLARPQQGRMAGVGAGRRHGLRAGSGVSRSSGTRRFCCKRRA